MKSKSVLIIGSFLMISTVFSKAPVVTETKPLLTREKKDLRLAFIGKWSSRQPTKKDGIKESTINRNVDSRYIIEHRVYDKNSTLIQESKEVGIWGVSGGIYFTVFRGWIENGQFTPSDPTDAYNYDTYKIKSVDADKLVYKNLSSGNEYIYTKIK